MSVFADTCYFVALLGPDGAEKKKAKDVTAAHPGRLVTTAWVLAELANFLHLSQNRITFVRIYQKLILNPQVTIVPANDVLFKRGIDLYTARPDKDWSLTDCISFVVMRDMKIKDALTADHHFTQAGFNALLR